MNIRATSQVLGVIGDPVAHSFSPDMHNAAIAALDVDYCYVAFHVLPDRVDEAMKGLRGLNIRGLNVTIPHKLAVIGTHGSHFRRSASCGCGQYYFARRR